MVLAFVLGSLMESSFRRSMLIFDGDPTGFVTRPISGHDPRLRRRWSSRCPLIKRAFRRRTPATDSTSDDRRPGSRRAMTILIGYVPTPVGEAALDGRPRRGRRPRRRRRDPQQPAPRAAPSTATSSTRTTADELRRRAAAAGVTATRRPRRPRRRPRRRPSRTVVEATWRPARRDRPAPPLARSASSSSAATPSACCSTSTCRSWPSSRPGEPRQPHLPGRRHPGRVRRPAAAQRRRRPPALRAARDRRGAHRLRPPRPRRDVRRRGAPRPAATPWPRRCPASTRTTSTACAGSSSTCSAARPAAPARSFGGMLDVDSAVDTVYSPFEVACLDLQGHEAGRAGQRPARRSACATGCRSAATSSTSGPATPASPTTRGARR